MIKVLFFAQLKELLNSSEITLDGAQSGTVDTLKQSIISSHPNWEKHLSSSAILTSVNQALVTCDHIVKDNDEVAFFPPVTGG